MFLSKDTEISYTFDILITGWVIKKKLRYLKTGFRINSKTYKEISKLFNDKFIITY